MLYDVANEPVDLTTALLMSMQVRFVLTFDNLTQNHAWYSLENLPHTCPEALKNLPQTTKNLPKTCPGPLKLAPSPDQV